MTADLFSLLTRIRLPGGSSDLGRAANQQHLFPLIGIVLGLIAAGATLILSEVFGADHALVSAGLVLIFLYILTGILHTEGLSDFADGLIARGDRNDKRAVMKDVHAGAAGVISVVLFLILFFAATSEMCRRASEGLSSFPLPWEIPLAIGFVLSEISGKLAMNTTMFMGPSSHEGMGSVFIQATTSRKYIAALAIGMTAAVLLSGLFGALVLAGPAAGGIVALISRKHFGGVSGDVFGAANEIGRLTVLVVWVLIA